MKAIVKATDEIVEVHRGTCGSYFTEEGRPFDKEELEFRLDMLYNQVKMRGWVARDKDGELLLFQYLKPQRESEGYWDSWDDGYIFLSSESFPNLTWEDEPLEVVITIRASRFY